MMNVTIISVGKLKEKYLKAGIAEYAKRLSPYVKLELIEVNDEKAPESLSEKEMEAVMEREGARILQQLKPEMHVIALHLQGTMLSSEELAQQFDKWATYGKSNVAFVIGGSLGLSTAVCQRADQLLSFSRFTFPHQLMRLILLEQIYRAQKINKGEPYHK